MLEKIHHKLISAFLWLSIVFLVGCLVPPAIMVWWTLDDTPPLSALAAKFVRWEVPPARGQPGVALVEWSGVRHRSCPGKAYRWLIGEERIWGMPPELVPYAGSTERFAGDTSRWVVPVQVPPGAADDGPLSYRVSFEWACNPLQHWWPLRVTVPDVHIPPAPAAAP